MILCGVISRGTTILAKYIQEVAGSNMNEFIDKVLGNISVKSDTRNSYRVTETEFLVHYIRERGIVYLAIAQQKMHLISSRTRRISSKVMRGIELGVLWPTNLMQTLERWC